MKKTNKRIPKFKNEDQERRFWATHSALDYFNTDKLRKTALPNLKPTVRSISIRLPESMLATLKILANKMDVPYQSLLKMFLTERIEAELAHSTKT
jgi:predicted DNA binding CopG/RHH family protein